MSASSPPTTVIRQAQRDDYPNYLRLYPALGLTEAPPAEAVWQEVAMPRALFLSERGPGPDEIGPPIGYAFYDRLPACGYVRNIMIADGYRRQGHGLALMNALAGLFRAEGCTEWRLNVEMHNRAAIGLYQRCGMAVSYRTSALLTPFAVIEKIPTPAGDLRVQPLPPDQDRTIETQFGMPAGLLTSLRTRPGEHILQLMDGSRSPAECVGVTRFSPRMLGAFPLYVREKTLVRPLLEAMRAMTPATQAAVSLTCEAQPDLVAFLRDLGAEVRMELFHMCGDLP